MSKKMIRSFAAFALVLCMLLTNLGGWNLALAEETQVEKSEEVKETNEPKEEPKEEPQVKEEEHKDEPQDENKDAASHRLNDLRLFLALASDTICQSQTLKSTAGPESEIFCSPTII